MPSYDIDKIRGESRNIAEVLFRLWETLRVERDLFPEERRLLALWAFDCGMGNGMWDMLVNERYSEVSEGIMAVQAVRDTFTENYLDSIFTFFSQRGLDCLSADSLERGMLKGAIVREQLDRVEKAYIDKIWDGALLQVAATYIDKNIEILRSRNKNEN